MKKLIFVLIISIFAFGCNQKISVVEFTHKKKDLTLKTPFNQNILYSSQLIHTDSIDIIACYFKAPQIYLYNFNTGDSIGIIPLKYKGHNLYSFYFHNKDSVFLWNNASYNPNYYHDSTLFMINIKGDIKDVYSYAGTPVQCSENSEAYNKPYKSITQDRYIKPKGLLVSHSSNFEDIYYDNNKLFLKFISSSRNADSVLEQNFVPAGGHINVKENKFYPNNVRLPYFGKNKYYNRTYKNGNLILSAKGNPLYCYGFTSEIQEYDLITKRIIKHYLKSEIIDTIIPTTKPTNDFEEVNGRYLHLYYNKHDNRYYRFFSLPTSEDAPPAIKNKYRIGVIVADSNFNKLGEGVLPEEISHISCIFTKEGIWFRNNKKRILSKDKFTYSLYNLNIKEISSDEFSHIISKYDEKEIPVMQESPLAYAQKTINFENEKGGVLLIPESSCPSCITWTLQYFKENVELMKKKNIHLVLSGKNKSFYSYYIQQANFPDDTENFHIDSTNIYQKYINNFYNPRLFLFDKNKLIHDKIYDPSDLTAIPIDIGKMK